MSLDFIRRAGLVDSIQRYEAAKQVRVANNQTCPAVGTIQIHIKVSVIVDVAGEGEPEALVYWDRHIKLKNVRVVDLGDGPHEHDLYVAFCDFNWMVENPPPLGQLVKLLLDGVKVLDETHVPTARPGNVIEVKTSVRQHVPDRQTIQTVQTDADNIRQIRDQITRKIASTAPRRRGDAGQAVRHAQGLWRDRF